MRYDLKRRIRRGLTLIELMIALAILAIAVAIIYPNVFPRKATEGAPSESAVIERAKALAVARAETLRLTIAIDGAWEISDETRAAVLESGQLPEAPAAPFALRVTELGACLPVTADRPVEGVAVDAVSCSVRP